MTTSRGACASTRLAVRRFADGGASDSRPCSVKTIRSAGDHNRGDRRVHEGRVVVAVHHPRIVLCGDARDGAAQRWLEPVRGVEVR